MILLVACISLAGESAAKGQAPSLDSAVQDLLAPGHRSPVADLAVHQESGRPWVDLLVRGGVSTRDIERLGGQVRTIAGEIRTVHLPVSALSSFIRLEGIEQVQAAQGLRLASDVSVPEIGAPSLWGGTPPNYPSPPTGNTGRGVVVGLIDSGVDVLHPDFRTSANRTRFLWIWDHNFGLTGPPPSGFGYGSEYSAANIDAGLYLGQDLEGHGSHVLSIAAGNGRATGNGQPAYRFVGVAPEADLIAVKLAPLANGSYSDVSIIDAAKYIFQKAAGKPTVILVALNKNTGPHDGQDPLDLGLSALAGAGKLIVSGAGNYGKKSLHGEYTSTTSNQTGNVTVNFGTYGPSGNASDNFRTEAWYDGSANYDVSVVTPTGQVVGPVARGGNTEVQTPSGIVRIKNGQTTSANGSYMVDLYIYRGSLTLPLVASGTWTYRFRSLATGTHRVDAWLTTFALGSTSPVFVQGMTELRLVASPGTGNNVLSAGAYSTKRSWTAINTNTYVLADAVVGNLAPMSSPGPRRDGVQAPDIAAPGYGVVGAKATTYLPASSYIMPDGQHVLNVGTSVAAAHLAGAVALWLGPTPTLSPTQARSKIQQFAYHDSYTGSGVTPGWGYGKLRVASSVVDAALGAPRLDFSLLSSNPVRGTVNFRLSLSEDDLRQATSVRLRIFDVRGRLLTSLAPQATPGAQTISWNGTSASGAAVPSGVYTASLEVGSRHVEYRFVRIQ